MFPNVGYQTTPAVMVAEFGLIYGVGNIGFVVFIEWGTLPVGLASWWPHRCRAGHPGCPRRGRRVRHRERGLDPPLAGQTADDARGPEASV